MMSEGIVTKSAETSSPVHAAVHVWFAHTGSSAGHCSLVSHWTHTPVALHTGASAGHSAAEVHAPPGPPSTSPAASSPAPPLPPHATRPRRSPPCAYSFIGPVYWVCTGLVSVGR